MAKLPAVQVESLLADDRGISVGVMYPGEDTPDGVPLVRVGDVQEGRVSHKPAFRISRTVHSEYKRTALEGNECLITLVGRPGSVVEVLPEMKGWNVARALAVIRLKEKRDNKFFQYAFAAPDVQQTIQNWCNTTVQATLNLKEIKALTIPWPSQELRAEMAAALSSLDDKIALNRRMNETLEALAQAIFKDWFVDFGPTRRKSEGTTNPVAILGNLIPNQAAAQKTAALFPATFGDNGLPEGWRDETLDVVCTVNDESWKASNHPDDVNYVDLSNTKWGVIESTSILEWKDAPSRAKRIAKSGDSIIGTVRPGNGSYAFVSQDGYTVSTGFAVLRPRQPELASVVYIASTRPENILRLANLADGHGGAYPAVNPSEVTATAFAFPGAAILLAFDEQAAPLRAKIEHNKKENRTLAETRDYLLPKLMSGEVRVRDAGKTLEAIS